MLLEREDLKGTEGICMLVTERIRVLGQEIEALGGNTVISEGPQLNMIRQYNIQEKRDYKKLEYGLEVRWEVIQDDRALRMVTEVTVEALWKKPWFSPHCLSFRFW